MRIDLRTLAQIDSEKLDWESISSSDADWILRPRLRLKYDISKKWDVMVFGESFDKFSKLDDSFLDSKLRYGGGIGFEPVKNHSFSIGYFRQQKIKKKKTTYDQALTLDYNYTINTRKKKKKK